MWAPCRMYLLCDVVRVDPAFANIVTVVVRVSCGC
jgi:hypothetical protein